MPEMTSYEPGTPSWVDLGTPDVKDAARFYGQLFGWDIQEGPPEVGGYSMCMLKGHAVAGIGPKMSPDQPTAWSTYVTVDDADKAAELATDAGGQVLMGPMDVMTVGRMAVFMDAAGAPISVWQPRDHIGAGLVNEPGTLCWNELLTRDVTGAKSFYNSVFGWEARDEAMQQGTYTVFYLGDKGIAGLMEMSGDMFPADMPPHWVVYFAVADCDASAAKITELGGTVVVPPMDIPTVGRFAVATDPAGAAFAIIKMFPQEPASN
jgi:predicted enzyme related to lactoylglutathione lyase